MADNKRYDSQLDEANFDTLAVRAGYQRSPEHEHSEALFLTSSYVFGNAQEAAAFFAGDEDGNVYSRYTNPTVKTFEQRLAALENAEQCVATASGMSAIFSTILALLNPGDHIVSSRSIFGSTNVQFEKFVSKLNVTVSFVELTDVDAWEAAIQDNTKMFYLESPSNPMNEVGDLEALAKLAKANNIISVVDNCFCTPALQKPLSFGIDVVIHSATKYIDGQGRCLGGAVLGSSELMEQVVGVLRSVGPTMSPFNAWVMIKGLETLSLRMKAHSENAMALATWLKDQPQVKAVHYAGLPEHPCHDLAKKQQSNFGGVLAFEVEGGQEAAWTVIDSTRMLSITANLGDAKTTITHPATTTHCRVSADARNAAGITDGLIRIACGIEDIEDIQRDLAFGLSRI
ncbi:O-succinylhomoserine sulfhydrylase [Bermanella marisrubri]|uniref:O-succinylhomoserine sulfhydrylase n=1 Tax=Bermanella marisrubri TaxID=207949 RepID=Q1N6Q1_9GAMM|nr:O-succinylhomoserine sulfhydrylase [Bermanella marisrubri]EAT13541.1 O-succinylhomoserine sulfhydrylase [Oceanobacter sp. RED65] [Bermanella marisrubri]QIZ84338.1 O-succinylhomoserine sulfhydrylase [Bermanella marisrubri]